MSGEMTQEKTVGKVPNAVLLEEVTRMLEEGNAVTLTARGTSMFPFINDGDKVVICRSDEVRRGDIVLARAGEDGYVLHRIVEMDGENAVLMGDANLRKTETCTTDRICGTVTAIIGKGGARLCRTWKERTLAAGWVALRPARKILLRIMKTVRK